MKQQENTLGNLNMYSEFRFKNGGNRYDVIEKTEDKIVYRQLTDYSNRVFEATGQKLKMKIIELV